jgi:hypothetical protein
VLTHLGGTGLLQHTPAVVHEEGDGQHAEEDAKRYNAQVFPSVVERPFHDGNASRRAIAKETLTLLTVPFTRSNLPVRAARRGGSRNHESNHTHSMKGARENVRS